MMFSTIRDGPTIYTNVQATLASLLKKYLSKNLVRQNKVQTLFGSENLPSSTLRISRLLFPLRVSPLHQYSVFDLVVLIDPTGICSPHAYIVFVTGPPGPRNRRAPASIPRPAPVNGPGRGLFFFNPCPCPRPGPRPVQCPEQPPVNEFSPPRAPLFRIFPSRTLLF